MLERKQVERILTANGVEPTADDEEIRAVLVGAEWHENDIDSALYVLKENPETHKSHIDALHRIQRTDEKLSPETIKAFMGIDVQVRRDQLSTAGRTTKSSAAPRQIMAIIITSVVFGVGVFIFGMWVMQVGFFHTLAS